MIKTILEPGIGKELANCADSGVKLGHLSDKNKKINICILNVAISPNTGNFENTSMGKNKIKKIIYTP